jgi:hypothetical protein
VATNVDLDMPYYCCYIRNLADDDIDNPDPPEVTGERCSSAADWEIRYGPAPDDFTHACEAHVGFLLQGGVENVAIPIEMIMGSSGGR